MSLAAPVGRVRFGVDELALLQTFHDTEDRGRVHCGQPADRVFHIEEGDFGELHGLRIAGLGINEIHADRAKVGIGQIGGVGKCGDEIARYGNQIVRVVTGWALRVREHTCGPGVV